MVLTITPLTSAEYLIGSVALGFDEYYVGVGEAPGVWSGRWAADLGLEGVVEADDLRALVDGVHPETGVNLVAGLRERKVKAWDLTFSAPKSVSLLGALGSDDVAATITATHLEAVQVAFGWFEERAAVARRQVDGTRRQVTTGGFVSAGFVHRTSRDGDPQLHTHCVVPNLVRRSEDGRIVAIDATPMHDWLRAAGCVYQNEVQRLLCLRLGVAWGPDRNNTREIVGFTAEQLRAFSKRTAAIEAELEATGTAFEAPALRMRADDDASIATRADKDHRLTPTALAGRWQDEARDVSLPIRDDLTRAVCLRAVPAHVPDWADLVSRLVDEENGVCSRSSRFTEADVIEHLCAASAGTMTVEEITETARRFLDSQDAVRLVASRTRVGHLPAWSTAAHRALEDGVLRLLDALDAARPAFPDQAVERAIAAAPGLGADQVDAVRMLCGEGTAVRCVLAPAGYGKTAMLHTAASAVIARGRQVIAVATTAKAVAELRTVGLDAVTIARLRIDLEAGPLPEGTVLVLDEASQTSTRDALAVLSAITACPDGTLWVLGDPRQSRSVKAGGLADELQRRINDGSLTAATLNVNRRQIDPADREALGLLRAGKVADSQEVRTDHGWEHDCGSPLATRESMAAAVAVDIGRHGPKQVVALTVSHGDAEDLADRIRSRLADAGILTGQVVVGPGWATDRQYQTGDRVLFHTRYGQRTSPLVNGTTATITVINQAAVRVETDDGHMHEVPVGFVRGCRADGSPNLSHAWARTVDGAQGGTWEAAHLLGSPALDQLRGYTGQSRSRQPTHTWNTSPIRSDDHGGRVADQRTPEERVAAALARQPDTSLAAHDDPHHLDRHLRAAIAEHQAVLAGRPADCTLALASARVACEAAEAEHAAIERRRQAAVERLDGRSAFADLTRSGRHKRRALAEEARLLDLTATRTAEAVRDARARVSDLERREALSRGFEDVNAWRREALDDLHHRLADHWTDVIVQCARADDPLAYGIHRLRAAHHHLGQQLDDLERAIPIDQTAALRTAEQARSLAASDREAAEHAVTRSRERLSRSRRRDQSAAQTQLDRAREGLRQALRHEHEAQAVVAELIRHQDARKAAIGQTTDRRATLTAQRRTTAQALADSLPARIASLATTPPGYIVKVLGDRPAMGPARESWIANATAIELRLDGHAADATALAQVSQERLRIQHPGLDIGLSR